ncbi:MAG: protein-tyrosine phosphatase [Saprospiraceae bacterium]|jgi:protein-tyrosine phosphatase
MICLGNICRSPLAEGILKKKIKENNLDWQVDSAGTGDWHIGEKPDERSIAVAIKYGINISGQKARQLRPRDLQEFDILFAMDSSNYRNIKTYARSEEERQKVELIMNLVKPGYNQNVPDPYYDTNGFEEVYQMLDVACDQIVEQYYVVGK